MSENIKSEVMLFEKEVVITTTAKPDDEITWISTAGADWLIAPTIIPPHTYFITGA